MPQHHRDVGDLECELHVLFDEHDRGAGVVGDGADDRQEPFDDDRGQSHAQFVDQQNLGLLHQRATDGEHLLFATGQCAGLHFHAVAQAPGSCRGCVFFALGQARLDVTARRRFSSTVRVVNSERSSGTRTSPAREALRAWPALSSWSADLDGSGEAGQQAGQGHQDGRLAGAVGAEECEHLPAFSSRSNPRTQGRPLE